MQSEIDIPAATIKLRADGIMHVHIKIEMDFEIEHSRQIVAARTELAQDQAYPILYTATKFVIPSKEVREYVASESRSSLVTADAFVINTLPQRIVAKLYRKINKPVRPTRVFSNIDEAVAWLRTFVVLEQV